MKSPCLHKRTWFDRSFCMRANGEMGMANICEDCGMDMTTPESETSDTKPNDEGKLARVEEEKKLRLGQQFLWANVLVGDELIYSSYTNPCLRVRDAINSAAEAWRDRAVKEGVEAALSKHLCVCGQWTLNAEGTNIKCDGCGTMFVPEYEIGNAVEAEKDLWDRLIGGMKITDAQSKKTEEVRDWVERIRRHEAAAIRAKP